MTAPDRRGRGRGDTARLPKLEGAAAPAGPRGGGKGAPTRKKKAGGARRTRVKARFNKKSGDVRSMPQAGAEVSGEKKKLRADEPLSGRAVRYLRGLGHHLDPIVQIGKEGLTDPLIAAVREALRAHELIKVKVGTESPIDRKEAGPELAARAGALLAQILGRTLLLYKRHPNKPKIEIPR